MIKTSEFIYTLNQMLILDLENKTQTKGNQIFLELPNQKQIIICAKNKEEQMKTKILSIEELKKYLEESLPEYFNATYTNNKLTFDNEVFEISISSN